MTVTECGQQPAIAEQTTCTADRPRQHRNSPGQLGLFPVWSWIPSWYIMAISRNSLVSRLHLHFTFSFFSFAVTGTTIYQTVGSKWKQALQESSLIKHTFGPPKRHTAADKQYVLLHIECVYVTVVVQHANRMRHVTFPSVPSPALWHFSTLSHKPHDFRKKKILNIKCVFWFYLQILYKIFLILRRTAQDTIISVNTPSCKVPVHFSYVKVPVHLSYVNEIWIFSTDFRKILKYQISWKSAQWEPSSSMLTDGQTDTTQLTDTFRNFANAPTKRWTDVLAHVVLSSGLWYCACVWSLVYDPVRRTT
jgi:hypothetical protein